MTTTNVQYNWRKLAMKATHFVRSITYGGDLVVRIEIECSDTTQFKNVKERVDSDLRVGGVIDENTKLKLKKIEKDIGTTSQIKITCYATSLEGQNPRNISEMLVTLDRFLDTVRELNNGQEFPCTCELVPLNVLDEELPPILRNKNLNVQLPRLEEYYDEVVQAKNILERAVQREDLDLTEEQKTRATELETSLDEIEAELNRVISDLDVTSNGKGVEQLKSAFGMYKAKKKPEGFVREVSKFVKYLKSEQAQATPLQDLPPGESLDLVLIGKTGHGKSATANSIFGEERFVSKLSSSSVTSKCQCEIGTIGGRKICLVDTPGTMDTRKPSESLVEIGTAIAYRPNGYHAFLLVLNVNARMTPEEKMAVIMLKRMFGEDVLMKFVVLVFTHGDTFYSYQKKSKTTPRFSDYILTQSGELAGLVEECGRRCVLMNNMEDDSRKQCDQVTELIHVIDNLVAHNGGARYTNIYFEVAKKELAKYEAAEKAEIERKRKAIEDEIKTATEKRMQERKKQIEEEAAAAIDKIERKKKVIEEEIKAEEERKKEVIKQRKKEEAAAKADRERRRKMREDEIIAEEERMKEEADREWRRERQRKMWEDTFIADKERREQHERKMAEMNRQRRAKEDELFKAEQRRQEAAAEAENAKRRKDIDDAIREAETFKENRLKELREHATAEAEVEEKRRIQQLEDEAKEAVKEGARPQDTIGKAIAREAEERGVSCFPADAEVILDSGKRMKIEDVVVGDKLLAAVDDDKFEFSEVYIIVHKDDLAVADFITISTGEASVTMTPDHHVFVVVDGIKQTIPARKVEAGNHVLICSEKASLTAQVVTEITRATGTGIYNPLTMAGTIVVNDVLASCYVDCVPPKVAHPLMSPVRQIHKWAPSLSKWVNDPTKTGMPSWIEWFMEYIIVPLKQ